MSGKRRAIECPPSQDGEEAGEAAAYLATWSVPPTPTSRKSSFGNGDLSKKSARKRLVETIVCCNNHHRVRHLATLKGRLRMRMAMSEAEFWRALEHYKEHASPGNEIDIAAIKDHLKDPRVFPDALNYSEPNFWWEVIADPADPAKWIVVPNTQNSKHFDSLTGLLHRFYEVMGLTELAKRPSEQLRQYFVVRTMDEHPAPVPITEAMQGLMLDAAPEPWQDMLAWEELRKSLIDLNPFREPDPIAFLLESLAERQLPFECGTYARGRRPAFRAGYSGRMYVRASRLVDMDDMLEVGVFNFHIGRDERPFITNQRNALVLNLYDRGILSVRRQTGAWVNVSWEAPPSPAIGCRFSAVHSLIPPRAPKELDFLALWDGAFYQENNELVPVHRFAAFFNLPLAIIRFFFCEEYTGDKDMVARVDYYKFMRWARPFINMGDFHAKMRAFYQSLRAQALHVALRDHSHELSVSKHGCYYVRYSDTQAGHLTVEVRGPAKEQKLTENFRLQVYIEQEADTYVVRYSLEGRGRGCRTANILTGIMTHIDRSYHIFWEIGRMNKLKPHKVFRQYKQLLNMQAITGEQARLAAVTGGPAPHDR